MTCDTQLLLQVDLGRFEDQKNGVNDTGRQKCRDKGTAWWDVEGKMS